MRALTVTARSLIGSGCSQMLTRYLSLCCLQTSTRCNRGGLPIFANTWDLIFSAWFGLGCSAGSFVLVRGGILDIFHYFLIVINYDMLDDEQCPVSVRYE